MRRSLRGTFSCELWWGGGLLCYQEERQQLLGGRKLTIRSYEPTHEYDLGKLRELIMTEVS